MTCSDIFASYYVRISNTLNALDFNHFYNTAAVSVVSSRHRHSVTISLFQSVMTPVRSVLLCVLLLLAPAAAINVLILHPVYAGSHELTLRVLGEQMVARGHTVTQIRSV